MAMTYLNTSLVWKTNNQPISRPVTETAYLFYNTMNAPKSPTIKTLDEILAELSPTARTPKACEPNNTPTEKTQKRKTLENTPKYHETENPQTNQGETTPNHAHLNQNKAKQSSLKQNRPNKTQSTKPNQKNQHNTKRLSTPNLPTSDKKARLETSGVIDERLAGVLAGVQLESITPPDKATQRLRWLAFYYLSNRELSTHQLRQKLLAKDCDPDAIEQLLKEFAEKGYQSDERTAYMLIRENIRRGRGKQHIRQALKTAKISYDHLETLITAANDGSLTDGTILTKQDTGEPVDWLALAVEARVKKYGDALPKDAKEKARQLRFLQYRGFEMGVCFDALKTTLADLDDR